MAGLDSLSNEVLLMVVNAASNPRHCHKKMRFLSKYFAEALARPLFDKIILPTDRVRPLPRGIGRHISTMTLQAVDCECLDYMSWCDLLIQSKIPADLRRDPLYRDRPHRKQAFKLYKLCRKDLQRNTTLCMTLLSNSLEHMPNLRHIYLTDALLERREDLYVTNLCKLPDCQYRDHDHTVLALPPISGLQTLGFKILSRLVKGLSRMRNSLPELTIRSAELGSIYTGFHYDALVTQSAQVATQRPHFVNVLSNLKALTLQLLYSETLERAYFAGHNHFNVSQILAHANNLVSLDLSTEPDYGNDNESFPDFRQIFHNCAFPFLETLTLGGFESTAPELIALTNGTPRIVKLVLSSHLLVLGTWRAILDHWKIHLPDIKNVELYELFETSGPDTMKMVCRSSSLPGDERAYWDRHLVLAFFVLDAVNPFA
ncbi:MAG: hypothetical protein Q9221_006328 [Calogaya cf. arnoldii]